MQRLILTCGVPGAGKSTWAHVYAEQDFGNRIVVSRDSIRFAMVSEDEEYFSKEKAVFREFVAQIKEGLRREYDVIADATHLNPTSRLKLIRALNLPYSVNVEVAVIMSDLDTCLKQNELRKGTRSYVPEGVIRNMHDTFVTPEYDEIPQGYDVIHFIYPREKEEENNG